MTEAVQGWAAAGVAYTWRPMERLLGRIVGTLEGRRVGRFMAGRFVGTLEGRRVGRFMTGRRVGRFVVGLKMFSLLVGVDDGRRVFVGRRVIGMSGIGTTGTGSTGIGSTGTRVGRVVVGRVVGSTGRTVGQRVWGATGFLVLGLLVGTFLVGGAESKISSPAGTIFSVVTTRFGDFSSKPVISPNTASANISIAVLPLDKYKATTPVTNGQAF